MTYIVDYDPEDVAETIEKITTSLGVVLTKSDWSKLRTYGDLCDMIKNKLTGPIEEDCTSQQAFYKLRQALGNAQLQPSTKLDDIFPKEIRRREVKKLENALGIKLNILGAPAFPALVCGLTLFVSFIFLFFHPLMAAPIFLTSMIILSLLRNWGIVLQFETLGDLATHMSNNFYRLSRRKNDTYNPAEVEKLIRDMFKKSLAVEEAGLRPNALLYWPSKGDKNN